MARLIEIKGLGDAVKGIRREMSSIRAVAGEINAEAPMLRAELTDIRDQIREHRADITAEAGSLGNGGEHGDKPPPKSDAGDKKPDKVEVSADDVSALTEHLPPVQ